MSTDEQIKQQTIEELLVSLKNNKSLRRSHNSVNISFRKMLAYINKIIETVSQDDINFLLITYRQMAKMFYKQYECSLLEEIKKQSDAKKQAEDAIKYIDGLTHNGHPKRLIKAKELLDDVHKAADTEYQNLVKDFPASMQSALDKLRNEWQRLNTIVVASQARNKEEKIDRALQAVAEVAAYSVGVEAERIAIVPGNEFALYFFSYVDNFAVLTVPIYSVQNPWEWSIFWHELSGYKVRRLEKSKTIDTIRKKLVDFNKIYMNATDDEKGPLLNSITWNNGMRTYIQSLWETEPNLTDLGGFEFQFEKMLTNLLYSSGTENKFQTYDDIIGKGWCVDWFKELFEDAWSVLAIGKPFLEILTDILGRNVAKDDRHPSPKVRLDVADELLKLIDSQEVMKKPSSVEESAAQQILKFISLIVAATRKYEKPDNTELEETQIAQQKTRNRLFMQVKNGIQKSISDWSKFLGEDNPSPNAKHNVEIFLGVFSDKKFEKLKKLLSELDQQYKETNQIKAIHTDLLKDMINKEPLNYKQLLELSFYDADFGVATVTNVFYKTSKFHNEAYLRSIPPEVTGGFVKYDTSTGTKHTSIDDWNASASPSSVINP